MGSGREGFHTFISFLSVHLGNYVLPSVSITLNHIRSINYNISQSMSRSIKPQIDRFDDHSINLGSSLDRSSFRLDTSHSFNVQSSLRGDQYYIFNSKKQPSHSIYSDIKILRRVSSFFESFFPKGIGADHIDRSFTDHNIDYDLLDASISETLKPGSKWRTALLDNPDLDDDDVYLAQNRDIQMAIQAISRSGTDTGIPLQNIKRPTPNQISSYGTVLKDELSSFSNSSQIIHPLPIAMAGNEPAPKSIANTTEYTLLRQTLSAPLLPSTSRKIVNILQTISDNISGTNRIEKELTGNSLLIFSPNNVFRVACYSAIRSVIFSNIMFLVIITETALLSYQMWDPTITGYYKRQKYSWIDYCLIVTNSVYTLGSALRIAARGFISDKQFQIGGPYEKLSFNSVTRYFIKPTLLEAKSNPTVTAYLRTPGNVMDFVGIVSFAISIILGLKGIETGVHFFLFRSLMCLKVLRLCNLTEGSRTVQRAIHRSLPVLSRIALILTCMMAWFSVISVQSFAESMRKKCVWFSDISNTFVETQQLCGGWLSSSNEKMSPAIGEYYIKHQSFNDSYYESILENRSAVVISTNPAKGFICPVNSMCLYGHNPNNDTLSFDNFWNSLQINFVILSNNTFTDLMYKLIDATSITEGAIFFVLATLVLTVWMTNILVASIVDTMNIAQEEENERTRLKVLRMERIRRGEEVDRSLNGLLKSRTLSETVWEWFCSCLITAEIIIMATNQSSEGIRDYIFIFSTITSAILFLDIIIRLLSYRFEFFNYSLNIVDFGLALTNLLILIPQIVFKADHPAVYGWLTFFQLIRIYRPMIAIPSIRSLWQAILGNLKDLLHLFAFSILLVFSISIIYARFFEGIISDPYDIQDHLSTMSSLTNVMMGLYVILTSENWTDIVYMTQKEATNTGTRVFIFIYFSCWFCFANLLIVNIFLSLITANLSATTEAEQKWHQVLNFFMKARKTNTRESEQFAIFDEVYNATGTHFSTGFTNIHSHDSKTGIFNVDRINQILTSNPDLSSYLKRFKYPLSTLQKLQIRLTFHIRSSFHDNSLVRFYDLFYFEDTNLLYYDGTFESDLAQDKENYKTREEFLKLHPMFNTTLLMFKPTNKLRRICQLIVPNFHGKRYGGDMEQYIPGTNILKAERSHWPSILFEVLVTIITIIMIILTCVMTPMYWMNHGYRIGEWNLVVSLDLFFSIFFSVEFLLHVIADGFMFTPSAFLMDKWGIISTFTLTTMWIDFGVELSGNSDAASFIRGMKSFRALRLLSVSKLTRDTFDSTIISGFHSIINAAVTSLSLLIPFAIWGVNILAGRLNSCNDRNMNMAYCHGDYISAVTAGHFDIMAPRAYITNPLNFDSFSHGLSTLFQITSVEGWTSLLHDAIRASGVGDKPTYRKFSVNSVFVIGFNVVSKLFILNIFLSEIIRGYSRKTGVAYLTDYQVGWNGYKNIVISMEPDIAYQPHFNSFETYLHNFFVKPVGIAKCIHILAYTILASALLYDARTDPGIYYKNIAILLCLVFLLIHHLAVFFYGSKKEGGNQSKRYAIIITCVVCIILGCVNYDISFENKYNMQLSERTSDTVQKVLLCFLFAFLPRMSPRLYTFMRFSILASKQFISLLFIWFVLFLVFAIGFNQTFGLTKYGKNSSGVSNCRNITNCSLFLFASSFGEGWNERMGDFFSEEPFCTTDALGYSDCGGKWQAYLYFFSWNILSMYLLMNVFVSIVVEAFKIMYRDNPVSQMKFDTTVDKFKKIWKMFDIEGSGFIEYSYLDKFLSELEKNRVFAHDEVTFKSSVQKQFREEVNEKAISEEPVAGKVRPFQFNLTLLLVVYYNYFSGEKHYRRTFEDYLWRSYLQKYRSLTYDDLGNPIISESGGGGGGVGGGTGGGIISRRSPYKLIRRATEEAYEKKSAYEAGSSFFDGNKLRRGFTEPDLDFLNKNYATLRDMGLDIQMNEISRGTYVETTAEVPDSEVSIVRLNGPSSSTRDTNCSDDDVLTVDSEIDYGGPMRRTPAIVRRSAL